MSTILSCLQILLQTSAGWLSHRYIHFYASHAENRNDFSSGRRISFLYLRLTSYCRTFLRRYLVVYRLYLCTFVHILIYCEVPNTSNACWREFPKHLLCFHFAITPMTLQSAETCATHLWLNFTITPIIFSHSNYKNYNNTVYCQPSFLSTDCVVPLAASLICSLSSFSSQMLWLSCHDLHGTLSWSNLESCRNFVQRYFIAVYQWFGWSLVDVLCLCHPQSWCFTHLSGIHCNGIRKFCMKFSAWLRTRTCVPVPGKVDPFAFGTSRFLRAGWIIKFPIPLYRIPERCVQYQLSKKGNWHKCGKPGQWAKNCPDLATSACESKLCNASAGFDRIAPTIISVAHNSTSARNCKVQASEG